MRYDLLRTNRKTLALTVDRNGRLTARAPLHMPLAQIESFITQKKSWIENTQARMASLPKPEQPLAMREGATLPYLGETLTLHYAPVARVARLGDQLLVPMEETDLTPVLRWLDAQARAVFEAQIRRLSASLGLRPKTLRLSRAHGRWGSMSTRGTLSLNHALILCPPDVLEYVMIHELCHIAHPNHSPAFWAKVEQCLPNYRTKRDWLREHQPLIRFLPDL